MDFADQFPEAEVIGTDLSPVQPGVAPPNLRFEIDDCCSEWTYPENSLDFIHVRCLYGSIADWPAFYQECLRHLRPGGYIEHAEFSVAPKSEDGSVTEGSIFDQWGKFAISAGEKIGKTFEVEAKMKGWVEEAGFEDVTERRGKWPIGAWSSDPKLKELGRWNALHWEEGMEGWKMALATRVHGVRQSPVTTDF
ncbi:S-adenosyl-L-methionine-dependent methyltransferase [Xylona heveae TC161]|uniref:S-adenosyl-L-methionine-dependent methyltransferase n=1 Tax=Xylona heveae (strain CBS 132557 / TC161) TaxID=1328760 RepID=A0A165GQ32_XYLHT|nr:S-adenosyl-L-methionine-dependent methyltransferase [Xylona heveae TC161]KZF22456.1 S-adenosyl-L-methionine-dependent methyltransferase [Xylona heveae TC161]